MRRGLETRPRGCRQTWAQPFYMPLVSQRNEPVHSTPSSLTGGQMGRRGRKTKTWGRKTDDRRPSAPLTQSVSWQRLGSLGGARGAKSRAFPPRRAQRWRGLSRLTSRLLSGATRAIGATHAGPAIELGPSRRSTRSESLRSGVQCLEHADGTRRRGSKTETNSSPRG